MWIFLFVLSPSVAQTWFKQYRRATLLFQNRELLAIVQWADCKPSALGWFAHRPSCRCMPYSMVASVLLSLPSDDHSHVLSLLLMPHTRYLSLCFSLCCAFVFPPKDNVKKGYLWLGGSVGAVYEAAAQEPWWRGARGPAGSQPSTRFVLPVRTHIVNHWINDHYLCIPTQYLREWSDSLSMYN